MICFNTSGRCHPQEGTLSYSKSFSPLLASEYDFNPGLLTCNCHPFAHITVLHQLCSIFHNIGLISASMIGSTLELLWLSFSSGSILEFYRATGSKMSRTLYLSLFSKVFGYLLPAITQPTLKRYVESKNISTVIEVINLW